MKLTKLHLFIILLLVLQFPLFDRVIENFREGGAFARSKMSDADQSDDYLDAREKGSGGYGGEGGYYSAARMNVNEDGVNEVQKSKETSDFKENTTYEDTLKQETNQTAKAGGGAVAAVANSEKKEESTSGSNNTTGTIIKIVAAIGIIAIALTLFKKPNISKGGMRLFKK